MEKECAFVVCKDRRGNYRKGASACGSRNSVSVPMKCPEGTKAVALSHNHPSGNINLSNTDKATGHKHKLSHVCVRAGRGLKCHRIQRR